MSKQLKDITVKVGENTPLKAEELAELKEWYEGVMEKMPDDPVIVARMNPKAFFLIPRFLATIDGAKSGSAEGVLGVVQRIAAMGCPSEKASGLSCVEQTYPERVWCHVCLAKSVL